MMIKEKREMEMGTEELMKRTMREELYSKVDRERKIKRDE